MPTRREALIEQVANQMMRSGRPGRLRVSNKQRQSFQQRHGKLIVWAIDNLPRCSAALPAVVVKCLIKYDANTVRAFCKALKNGLFNGQEDPAHWLWKFLQKHKGHDTIAVYQRAVCAAKAYMEGRTLNTLRPLKEDIFAWDEGWTVPDEYLTNWTPDGVPGEDPNNTISREEIAVG